MHFSVRCLCFRRVDLTIRRQLLDHYGTSAMAHGSSCTPHFVPDGAYGHYVRALLLLPGLCLPGRPPFIFFIEYELMSPVDLASLLFAKRFLPPNPNFASFFCRLVLGPLRSPFDLRSDRSALAVSAASSSATSNMSSSLAVRSAPCRSAICQPDATSQPYTAA